VPAVELLEIGAGGGSLAVTDMGLIKVGPESAGADPGPACYRRGGDRPTVTDANLVLGYINPDNFNGGAMRLDRDAAAHAINLNIGDPLGLSVGEAAWGVHVIANANMERAMRIVSVERGRDPRHYALVAFGGAGPLHAARLARMLGIPKIIVPFGAGVGSAIGMLEANAKLDASLTRLLKLEPGAENEVDDIYRQLEARIAADMARMGTQSAKASTTRFAYMRYAGQGHEIRVDLPDFPVAADFVHQVAARFEAAYRNKYGYCQPGAVVEAVDWYAVVSIVSGNAGSHRAENFAAPSSGVFRRGTRDVYLPEMGGYAPCAVIDRGALPVGEFIEGPSIIEEAEATTLLLPNCTAAVSPRGHLVIAIGEV
jgi:N-methylhydantoinase A